MPDVMLTTAQTKRLRTAPMLDTPNKLALAMKLSGVTQMEIQAGTGIPQSYISRVKRGDYSRLSLDTARALATFFGCHIEDLFPSREAMSA